MKMGREGLFSYIFYIMEIDILLSFEPFDIFPCELYTSAYQSFAIFILMQVNEKPHELDFQVCLGFLRVKFSSWESF